MIEIPPDRLILLDSCTLIQLQRANATGVAIDAAYGLKSRVERPLLSTVVEGEVNALARTWNWGSSKIAKLEQNLAQLVRIPAGDPSIVSAYSKLWSQQAFIGKKLGENDTWIAASAVAIGAVLLTCDSDFLLAASSVEVAYFDVSKGAPGV